MSTQLDRIWSEVRAELSQTINDPVYRIWLEPLRAVELTSNCLVVQAPAQTCGWIRERFGRTLQACVAAVLGPDFAIDIVAVTPGGQPAAGRTRPTSTGLSTVSPQPAHAACGNPKLTFDQFVIGDSNRLAHAAALAVSELPAHAYNPLFICGPPGVGKTHLLRSIATFIAAYNPGLNVRSTTGEAFTNGFLRALGSDQLSSFKAGFRHVDVLLIDDVQFLERKTKTEEEFFHTFNDLYDAGSQIVLSSDRPPSDLQALEDRLRERFQSGLVADVKPPDLSTRLAILRKRAQHDGIELADPRALDTIAQRIDVNVRALEGALIRVVAFSSLTGRPLTVELATEVLDGLYPKSEPRPHSIAEIKAAACEQFGLSPEELLSPTRTARIAWPRQVAMYLSRELTRESLPAIGREFGGRDHTTVLHAWRRTEQRISANPASRATVEELRSRLTSTSS
ncbi:MAG TPA: chromosomal replication initiator protein DnaA [Solirubrobacteraceae bacterium]|nr:chromosomal replication initiator protein DnaA [Solirubrobacteraceae bacterium]